MPTFGDVVKSLRIKNKLTQAELAKKLTAIGEEKITRSAVSMWEMDQRRPKFEVLETIADFFNVDMFTLLGRPADQGSREITAREALLLDCFDKLPLEFQDFFLVQVQAAADRQQSQDDQK